MAPNLDELFARLRFDIEGDLIDLKHKYPNLPECKSQSLRALRAAEFLREDIMKSGLIKPLADGMKLRLQLRRQLDRLEDFLSVHRTIMMLEDRLTDHWKKEKDE